MRTITKKNYGSVVLELLIIVAVFVAIAGVVAPSFAKMRAHDQVATCASNVRAIGIACEMYSTDHEGCFPDRLEFLTVGADGPYLAQLPACPSAGVDTYSGSGYQVSADKRNFTVNCHGSYHADAGLCDNMPMYSSVLEVAKVECTPQHAVVEANNSELESQPVAVESDGENSNSDAIVVSMACH